MRPALTILTDPIPIGRFWLKERMRRLARPIRAALFRGGSFRRHARYRGHPAVTRSLVEGLQKLGLSANFNPSQLDHVGKAVLVLSGTNALAQAIEWKQRGLIARLLAGPNILVFPSDHADLIAAPEVDLCVTPAEWVCKMYEEDCQDLKGRCIAWPAGVDTEYWSPDPRARERREVVVFVKQAIDLLSASLRMLEQRGFAISMIRYGSYTQEEYRRALRRATFLIGFSASESQGLAWAEAWSADVPTFLWFQDHLAYRGRILKTSTAPYLTEHTGAFFQSVEELAHALDRWEVSPRPSRPRDWVSSNMSDEVCAERLWRWAVSSGEPHHECRR
jgi:hypothetical protein